MLDLPHKSPIYAAIISKLYGSGDRTKQDFAEKIVSWFINRINSNSKFDTLTAHNLNSLVILDFNSKVTFFLYLHFFKAFDSTPYFKILLAGLEDNDIVTIFLIF